VCRLASMLVFGVLISACATVPPSGEKQPAEPRSPVTVTSLPSSPDKRTLLREDTGAATEIIPLEEPGALAGEERKKTVSELHRGTGTFVNTREAYRKKPVEAGTGEYTLNFEATDIQEVVKIILGDILKESYFIDPKVAGVATIQTSRPLTKQQLLPTLENLLRLNGAALRRVDGIYKIVPIPQARSGSVGPAARGYGTRIVPLRSISAREMGKLLEPFLAPDSPKPLVDEPRNVLILSGSEPELQGLMELVEVFDVDWLQGMSLGIFKLQNAEAKTLVGELEKVFLDKDSPLTGLLRLVPIERLNALLVITQRPGHLDQARRWIEQLDQVTDAVDPQIYVYRVKNGKAKDLAAVLAGIFGAEAKGPPEAPEAELAPGESPLRLETEAESETERPARGGTSTDYKPGGTKKTGVKTGETAPTVVATETLRIIADEATNSLVIHATAQDYKMIEAALRHLDIVPLQVLIEASVVEVTLMDELRYGVEWFFNNKLGEFKGRGTLDLIPPGAPAFRMFRPLFGGFSYGLLNSQGQVSVALQALASKTKLNVLSSPSLMVLDNHAAVIKRVQQIPVISETLASTTADPNVPSVRTSSEYKDAGVILEVTPRINVGGRITLELVQEVSEPGPAEPPTFNPSFQQRQIQSTVTVQSGETLVLGGLIQDNRDTAKSSIPLLSDIPLLGPLFRYTTDTARRTELIVLLTPKAVRSQEESRAVTEEFRQRLKDLETITPEQYHRREKGL
jgi:general secretion pathway protein D